MGGSQIWLDTKETLTVNEMLKGKFYIVPGAQIKCLRFIAKIVPNNIIAKFAYKVQERKR